MIKIKCPYCNSDDTYLGTTTPMEVCLHDALIDDYVSVTCFNCNTIFKVSVEAKLTDLTFTVDQSNEKYDWSRKKLKNFFKK